MEKWEDIYAAEIARGDLAIISIHTVFEGHTVQTTRSALIGTNWTSACPTR